MDALDWRPLCAGSRAHHDCHSYEQMKTLNNSTNPLARSVSERTARFGFFQGLLTHYMKDWNGKILRFEEEAARVFQGFEPSLIRRIGAHAQIAGAALAHKPPRQRYNRRQSNCKRSKFRRCAHQRMRNAR